MLLWAASNLASAGTSGFQTAVTYQVGTKPVAVASGDFNGDGKQDLAVANFGSASDNGGISILLGNGDGTFQPANNVAAGQKPHALAASDFNRDSKDDLALIDGLGLGVLLGNGDGAFGAVSYFPTSSFPHSLAVSDLNSDNIPDLVVAASSLSVLLGNGDGTFQSHVDYSGIGVGGSMVVGDVNGDGKLDVILSGNGVDVLLGNGDGSFQNAIFSTGPYFTLALVAKDFNLDGELDLAVSFNNLLGKSSGTVVRPGNGDGTFQSPPSTDFQSFGAMSAADFNGDGKADLVIVSGGTANFFLGNGDATFGSASSFAVGTGPWSVATADLNNDKAPDLIITNSADNTISVLLNNGTDFSLSASAFSPGRIGTGQSASSKLSLNLLSSFNNPIALSCSVQPAQAGAPTCSINPSSAIFDSAGQATAQVTVTAEVLATSSRVLTNTRFLHLLALAFVPIAGLSFVGKRAFSKRVLVSIVFTAFFAIMIYAVVLSTSSCGGGEGPTPRAKNYSVTVTAKSGSAQHSTTLTLSLQ